jgi:hypothetical protein
MLPKAAYTSNHRKACSKRARHDDEFSNDSSTHLSRTVSSSTTDTRDTGNGTTGSPRLGRGLVTSVLSNRVRLATVLVDALVDLSDDVVTDGGREDGG